MIRIPIDKITITVIPVILGSGIPLFGSVKDDIILSHLSTTSYDFGFVKSKYAVGLNAPYPIPEEHANAWMVQELSNGILGKVKGTVKCSKVLDQPQYWRE